jgi:signal peptidase II
VLAADAVSKAIVVAKLSGHAPVTAIPHVLTLTLTRNAGAAFSIGGGATVLFTLVALGVVAVIVRTARSMASRAWAVTLGLLLGGALGNLSDRLLRSPAPLRGHVVDWLELPHWPVFNLADSAIVAGGVLAVLLAGRGIELDGTRR